jgi:hypothetical protein
MERFFAAANDSIGRDRAARPALGHPNSGPGISISKSKW